VTAKKESAEIARGTASVVIDSDKEAKPTVFLTPVTGGADGAFSYDVTLPEGAKGALTLTGPEKRKIPLTADDNSGTEKNLPPGEYRLEGLIFKGAERVNFANEVVYLYSGLESAFTRNFSSVALVEKTAAEILASLSSLPENDAATPYTLDLSGLAVAALAKGEDALGLLYEALNGKYVDLDLSGCDWTAIPNTTYATSESRPNEDKIVSLTLPDTLKTLGSYAFRNCTSLTSVNLPDSLETLEDAAFRDCTSLKAIDLPDGLNIKYAAFYGCSSLETIDLSGCLISGSSAFSHCSALVSVNLPASLTNIMDYTFSDCKSLESIIIPYGVTSIGFEAFFRCEALKTVSLPDTLTSLGNEVFYVCKALVSIDLPDSLTTIGYNNFRDAYSLELVISRNTTPPSAGHDFLSNTPSTLVIYVPDESVEEYQKANEWKNFADKIKPLSEYEGE
jgi:hypothetical protein